MRSTGKLCSSCLWKPLPLAIIGLLCSKARVKFKTLIFWTEVDFAYYCTFRQVILQFPLRSFGKLALLISTWQLNTVQVSKALPRWLALGGIQVYEMCFETRRYPFLLWPVEPAYPLPILKAWQRLLLVLLRVNNRCPGRVWQRWAYSDDFATLSWGSNTENCPTSGLFNSRPDISIRHGFYQIPDSEHQDFVLHNVPPTIVNHDISLFLEYNLGIIRQECTLGPDWPGEAALRQLVLCACGLFIWTATVCRFIREGKRFARKRLDTILKGSSSTITAPEKHLNEIYLITLKNSISLTYSDEEKEEVYDTLKYTLRSLVVLLSPLSTPSLSRLLHLPREDVNATFDDLYTILDIPEDLTRQLRLHHPSFRDFLPNKDRCRDF